jgi:hypothetical protein
MRGQEWSGAPCLQSMITIEAGTPAGSKADLLVRLESYDFVDEGYENMIQRHQYHYRKVKLPIYNP